MKVPVFIRSKVVSFSNWLALTLASRKDDSDKSYIVGRVTLDTLKKIERIEELLNTHQNNLDKKQDLIRQLLLRVTKLERHNHHIGKLYDQLKEGDDNA